MARETIEVVDGFKEGLSRLEGERDSDRLVGLFAEDCTVGNVASPKAFHGTRGARAFWHQYRNLFDELQSTFNTTLVGDAQATLEWRTEGRLATGRPVSYQGVSVIDVHEGRITRFHAYFDPSELGIPPGAGTPGAQR